MECFRRKRMNSAGKIETDIYTCSMGKYTHIFYASTYWCLFICSWTLVDEPLDVNLYNTKAYMDCSIDGDGNAKTCVSSYGVQLASSIKVRTVVSMNIMILALCETILGILHNLDNYLVETTIEYIKTTSSSLLWTLSIGVLCGIQDIKLLFTLGIIACESQFLQFLFVQDEDSWYRWISFLVGFLSTLTLVSVILIASVMYSSASGDVTDYFHIYVNLSVFSFFKIIQWVHLFSTNFSSFRDLIFTHKPVPSMASGIDDDIMEAYLDAQYVIWSLRDWFMEVALVVSFIVSSNLHKITYI